MLVPIPTLPVLLIVALTMLLVFKVKGKLSLVPITIGTPLLSPPIVTLLSIAATKAKLSTVACTTVFIFVLSTFRLCPVLISPYPASFT